MKKLDSVLLATLTLLLGVFAGAYVAYNVLPIVKTVNHYWYTINKEYPVRLV